MAAWGEAMVKHLLECGIVVVGAELHLLHESRKGTLMLPLPQDLSLPIPSNGNWVEGVHWSCGVNALMCLHQRNELPIGGSFHTWAVFVKEYAGLARGQSYGERVHELARTNVTLISVPDEIIWTGVNYDEYPPTSF